MPLPGRSWALVGSSGRASENHSGFITFQLFTFSTLLLLMCFTSSLLLYVCLNASRLFGPPGPGVGPPLWSSSGSKRWNGDIRLHSSDLSITSPCFPVFSLAATRLPPSERTGCLWLSVSSTLISAGTCCFFKIKRCVCVVEFRYESRNQETKFQETEGAEMVDAIAPWRRKE